MSTIERDLKLQIPDRMKSKLVDFQRRVWRVKLAEGLLAAAFGLLVSYLLVFALDRFIDTSPLARAAILIIGVLGLGVWFPLVCHKWIWKNRRLEQVARLLRFKLPRLSDHLLGIIELVNNHEEAARSEALCRAALAQVDEETKDKDFTTAVPSPQHRQWLLIAGVPAVIAAAAMIVVPLAGSNAMARWLMPWKQIERYTFAQIERLPERIVVPTAEYTNVDARLKTDSPWSPAKGSVYVNGQWITSKQNAGTFGFSLPPLKKDSDLYFSIGDARQKVIVEPKSRPELSSLVAKIQLPEYLQRTSDIQKDIRGGTVTTIPGSRISFTAEATRELNKATVNGVPQNVDGQYVNTMAVDVDKSTQMEFCWSDVLGLTSKTPLNLKIRVDEDESPTLVCTKLSKQRVMLEKDVLSFNVSANDDFGVKTIGMEWAGVADENDLDDPVKGEKIVSAGDPESVSLDAVATFSPTREGLKPQVIQLRLFVQDYLPSRERVYSPTYTVFVLSEEEHAIWLTRRLDQWYKQSLETYEREQQLFKRNIELRELSPEEIDRPENRRKIESQATAEKAQQRRLSALTGVGSDLVKEATRNDQFNVATLEKLSEMLQALDDIAENRMPSVSDLLQKAADASTSDPSGKKSDPSQAESDLPPSVSDNKDQSPSKKGKGASSKVPSVNMTESNMDKKEPGDEESDEEDEQESKPGGRLTLPSVTLKDNSPSKKSEPSPAQDQMQEAVDAQEDLLAEFQRVAEELKRIISNLEGSTFVKRLKAMSRRQVELAEDVNKTTLGSFGVVETSVKASTKTRSNLLANRQIGHSKTTTFIQDDLEAYANRVQEGKFKTVLSEMKSESVVNQLQLVSDRINANDTGSSIAHTEFLADTFDRWAEQLVGPG